MIDRFPGDREVASVMEPLEFGDSTTKREVVTDLVALLVGGSIDRTVSIRSMATDLSEEAEFNDLNDAGDCEAVEKARSAVARLARELAKLSSAEGAAARPMAAWAAPTEFGGAASFPTISDGRVAEHRELSLQQAQHRGSSFEKWFVNLLLDAGMDASHGYAQAGEQIDGHFSLDGRFWIIESKWHQDPIEPQTVSGFAEKVERRPHVAGMFVSVSGFSKKAMEFNSARGRPLLGVVSSDIDALLARDVDPVSLIRQKWAAAQRSGDFCPLIDWKQLAR